MTCVAANSETAATPPRSSRNGSGCAPCRPSWIAVGTSCAAAVPNMTSTPMPNSQEAADRLAIRELFDAYAHCADRRDAEGQKSLFTEDTHFVVYMEGE